MTTAAPCQPGPSGSLVIPAPSWRGGSLPNVHEISGHQIQVAAHACLDP